MKTYLLVDANNLAARCHHAMIQLARSDGQKTGAIMGFLKGLSWVRWKTHIPLRDTVIIWDGGHSAARKELLPSYKAGRKLNEPVTREEKANKLAYREQLEHLQRAMTSLEVRQVKVPGVEADDLIGIFANLATKNGDHSIIYSGDGDMYQLFSPTCRIFDPQKDLLGWGDIQAKFGVEAPEDLKLFRAVVGDTSDNIKGVKGLGKKRAQIVCSYLRARLGIEQDELTYKIEPKPGRVPSSKDQKHVDKALAEKKILVRNLKLMVLPKSFEDSMLTFEQYEAALLQWMSPGTRNTRTFIEFLNEFELHSILENLSNW